LIALVQSVVFVVLDMYISSSPDLSRFMDPDPGFLHPGLQIQIRMYPAISGFEDGNKKYHVFLKVFFSSNYLCRYIYISLQRYEVIKSHKNVKIEVFLNFFGLLMEGSGSLKIFTHPDLDMVPKIEFENCNLLILRPP
jgi:hypothetical protein